MNHDEAMTVLAGKWAEQDNYQGAAAAFKPGEGEQGARAGALAYMTEYGPDYDRNVACALADYRLFAGRGESESAERFLLMAEMRAGLISFEDFQRMTTGRLF